MFKTSTRKVQKFEVRGEGEEFECDSVCGQISKLCCTSGNSRSSMNERGVEKCSGRLELTILLKVSCKSRFETRDIPEQTD